MCVCVFCSEINIEDFLARVQRPTESIEDVRGTGGNGNYESDLAPMGQRRASRTRSARCVPKGSSLDGSRRQPKVYASQSVSTRRPGLMSSHQLQRGPAKPSFEVDAKARERFREAQEANALFFSGAKAKRQTVTYNYRQYP